MNNHKIIPEKITRPMQLLAAWLTGLIIVDSSFLIAAAKVESPNWAPGALVIAAIVNVPLFLVCLFLLQTKFRAEMQEDAYYSKYLEQQYTTETLPTETANVENQAKEVVKQIMKELGPELKERKEPIERIIRDSQVESVAERVGNNRSLSELFLRPHLWSLVVARWKNDKLFRNAVSNLIEYGVATMKSGDYTTCKLTGFGRKVAEVAESQGILFAQMKGQKEKFEEEGISLTRRPSVANK